IRLALRQRPGLRFGRASFAGQPMRQSRVRARREATLALRELGRKQTRAPCDSLPVQAHPLGDVRAHRSYAAAATPAACRTPELLAPCVPSGFFYFRLLWRCCAASPGDPATYTRRPFASAQGAGRPSSTSLTRSRMGSQKFPSTANGFPGITDLFNISQTTASSTSVPVPPLHATKASAHRMSSKSLSSQVFMRTSRSIQGFSFAFLKKSAVTPYVFPPASFAPRDTASITPP